VGISPYRRTSAKDNPSADFSEQIAKKPIVDGMLVTGTVVTGEAFALVRHGLGRPYRGAVLVGCSAPSPDFLYALLPADADELTDISKFVYVRADATFANDATISLWVL
jgi:hypothetical protein